MNQSSNPSRKSQTVQGLIKSGIFPAISSLSTSSRGIPSNEDFHFYNNFSEFKLPTQHIATKTQSLLELVGSLDCVFQGKLPCPNGHDIDDVCDWLVDVNDEILDRVDMLIDELEKLRAGDQDDGFKLVCAKGKRNKGTRNGVRMVDSRGYLTGKAKVPYHISSLKRPQNEYSILVNNSNKPFEHVWLQSSDDGSTIHPLEKLSVLDFVDKITEDYLPASPLLIQDTPFHLVEDVQDLKMMAAKLKSVNEFSVDLEHNQYRTFQGLTCLMQISTRSEDFVIDTLKLKIHIGPYLREVFKDPSKKKVMHGADHDIIWLQRDFGIYVCNMFDTGQASRVLKLERYSLQFLLDYFCKISSNKEYQNADWRLRPLPDEMLRYAREDTHYLLSIYDTMKVMLLSLPPHDENSDPPLLEVYQRSYDICKQLYEKELLTESSYLHMYGLPEAGFTAQQLAIVSGLYEWRDAVARAEDESTGYILPNKTLLLIAKEMPVTIHQLRPLLNSRHTYLERNMAPVLAVIRHSMQKASGFEGAVMMLKEARIKTVASEKDEVRIERSITAMDSSPNLEDIKPDLKVSYGGACAQPPPSRSGTVSNKPAVLGASIQVMKKPAGAFAALLGTSTGKKNLEADDKDARTTVLENIRSSVNLPFHSFRGTSLPEKSEEEKASCGIQPDEPCAPADTSSPSASEDVIILDHECKEEEKDQIDESGSKEKKDDSITLSALSTSFQKCLMHNNRQNRTRKRNGTSMIPADYCS